MWLNHKANFLKKHGEERIRTFEGHKTLTVFKTVAFNHSATSPGNPLPKFTSSEPSFLPYMALKLPG